MQLMVTLGRQCINRILILYLIDWNRNSRSQNNIFADFESDRGNMMQQGTACPTVAKRFLWDFDQDTLIAGVKISIQESAPWNYNLKFHQMIGAQSGDDQVLTLKIRLIKRKSGEGRCLIFSGWKVTSVRCQGLRAAACCLKLSHTLSVFIGVSKGS